MCMYYSCFQNHWGFIGQERERILSLYGLHCEIQFVPVGIKTLNTGNINNICVGNTIRSWDYNNSNNGLGQWSHWLVVSSPWQSLNVSYLDKSKKENQNKTQTQCLAHSKSLLSFFATSVPSLTECFPPTFLQPSKTHQIILKEFLAVYAQLWDELQIQIIVVAFMIKHHTSLPFLKHRSKEMSP